MLHSILQRITTLGLSGILLAGPILVRAQDHALDHEPLQKSASLTFAEVLASALDNAPELLAAEARQGQASAYQNVGGSLFAGNPSLQASYIDDRTLSNVGLREIEAGVAVPLWRPGQKKQAQNLGRNYDAMYQSWLAYTEWQVIGRLREVLVALYQAETLLEFERATLAASEELLQLTTALFDAGDVPELDVLTVRSLVIDQRNAVYEAEAEVVDAERNYQIVTGLNVVQDSPFTEQAAPEQDIGVSHPWLSYLRANVDVAKATVDQVRQTSIGNPVLGFGFRRERGSRFDDSIDSLGISIDIPLGKSARAEANASDARRAEADLQVALQQARISLNQRLHEAEHTAYVTQQKLQESRTKETLSQQRWEMARLAYELGETDLYPVQMALLDLQATQKQRRSLEMELQALYSQMNQTLGIQP